MGGLLGVLICVGVSVLVSVGILSGTESLRLRAADATRRLLGHPWARLAAELGLEYHGGLGPGGHRLLGAIHGRAFLIRTADTETGRLRLSRSRMPDDPTVTIIAIRSTRPIADERHHDGPGAGLLEARLIHAPSLLSWSERVVIGPARIVVTQRGLLTADLASLLERLDAMCADLEERSVAPWEQAARQMEMTLSQAPPVLDSSDPPELELSRAEGAAVPLRVRIVRLDEGVETLIQTRLPQRLNGLTLIRRRRADDRPGTRLGQPILDSLVIVEGELSGTVAARLREPDACAVLLSVVHAWPGSSVSAEAITMRLPGRAATGLSDRIAEVLELRAIIAG